MFDVWHVEDLLGLIVMLRKENGELRVESG
jgi:hypothetical protein